MTPWTIATRLLCPWDSPGKSTAVGCHCLLQEIFSTQGSNLGLLYCRQILNHLSHQGRFMYLYMYIYIGEGNGTPLQCSCLENPMDRGAWWAVVHGVVKSQTWLSDFTFTFHFYSLEKEMATHSSVLAWRIPGMGPHRVRHDWSDLAVVYIYYMYIYIYMCMYVCMYMLFSKRKLLCLQFFPVHYYLFHFLIIPDNNLH